MKIGFFLLLLWHLPFPSTPIDRSDATEFQIIAVAVAMSIQHGVATAIPEVDQSQQKAITLRQRIVRKHIHAEWNGFLNELWEYWRPIRQRYLRRYLATTKLDELDSTNEEQ